MSIAVITTFGNQHFEIYAKSMLQSFAQYWPLDIPLLVQLDDDLLHDQVQKCLRQTDAIAIGLDKDHKEFVERNKGKDDPTNYRKQAVRFCHKVFSIKRALGAIQSAKANNEPCARYLIWMDADVITTKMVTMDDIKACLPKEGDAVAYLGRKDWDHSECGWLAFDLENSGDKLINSVIAQYLTDGVFELKQWHDSFVWDFCMQLNHDKKCTNLTLDKPGMDIWPHSPMGQWSTHYKGQQAKANFAQASQKQRTSNIVIETKNSLPDEKIKENIRTNQLLIKNWLKPCLPNNEEIVVVSAGPMLVAEDVRDEVKSGRKIIAVKHALEPLERAGIIPWACILLDPREHVAGFVEKPDKNVKWFVASQVNPEATKRLLESGCEVWGYHASVGANEEHLTNKQEFSVVHGGSATATRGLYLLSHLGFNNFRLYGYDLCYPDKPKDLNATDTFGQPKYLDISVGFSHPNYSLKHCFWSEPQLIAQFEEINDIIKTGRFKIKAFGMGMIPFVIRAKETGELREKELKAKLKGAYLPTYERLFGCNRKKKIRFSMRLPKLSLPNLLKRIKSSN